MAAATRNSLPENIQLGVIAHRRDALKAGRAGLRSTHRHWRPTCWPSSSRRLSGTLRRAHQLHVSWRLSGAAPWATAGVPTSAAPMCCCCWALAPAPASSQPGHASAPAAVPCAFAARCATAPSGVCTSRPAGRLQRRQRRRQRLHLQRHRSSTWRERGRPEGHAAKLQTAVDCSPIYGCTCVTLFHAQTISGLLAIRCLPKQLHYRHQWSARFSRKQCCNWLKHTWCAQQEHGNIASSSLPSGGGSASHTTGVLTLCHGLKPIVIALAAAIHKTPARAAECSGRCNSRGARSVHWQQKHHRASGTAASERFHTSWPCQQLSISCPPALLRLGVEIERREVSEAGAGCRRQLAGFLRPAGQARPGSKGFENRSGPIDSRNAANLAAVCHSQQQCARKTASHALGHAALFS